MIERRLQIMIPSQNSLCRLLASIFVATLIVSSNAATPAQAGEWWESIVGHGNQLDRRDTKRPRSRRKAVLKDLRKNPTPLRSPRMLDAMQFAIERYQKIVNKGGWPQIPGSRLLRPGDSDERVGALRRRLIATGDLRRTSSSGFYDYDFDEELAKAVRAFQTRHGLRVSGRVDRSTLAALNVSASMRLQQLRLNLARLRTLMQDRVEDRYILVNVPAFQLEAVDRHQVDLRHRVIVGRTGRDTPTVKAIIKGLNFFPYWRVPESVAISDLIPRLQKDQSYLEKEHIRVVKDRYDGEEIDPLAIDWFQVDTTKVRFRQDPGPWNALGLVRIDMPNEHVVYMHDTPMKNLFNSASRAYSAGCVRVQDVMQLVEWIARYEPGWDQPGRTEQILALGQPLDVELTRPVPVYFTYITAWGEPNGLVQFRHDIYQRDGAPAYASGQDQQEPLPWQTLAP